MIPRTRRRWFRYSLRTLFVVMTLAAIASLFVPPTIAWFLPESNPPSSFEMLPFDIVLKHDLNGQVAMYMGDRPVDQNYLRNLLTFFDQRTQAIILHADKRVSAGEVATIVDQLVRLGLKKRLIITKPANSQTVSP